MKFRILGPLEVVDGAHRVDLGSTRQQTALAVLLLDHSRGTSIGRLIEAVYDDNPPTTCRSQVQICISALRRVFAQYGRPNLISTHSQGYAIEVGDDDELDCDRFQHLILLARRSGAAGAAEAAVGHYREALALWRGHALEGMDSRLIRAAARRLTEDRITAHEKCIELELSLGRHREVIAELTELVERYPLREQLRGQLMTALYQSGREAEALHVYREGRRILVEELGIEPNERLRRLEHAIRVSVETGRPAPAPAAAAGVAVTAPRTGAPRMLPAGIADFTGRAPEVDAVRRLITPSPGERAPFAVPIAVITGKPGVGKSTLAVHTAHTVAERFPDGQLFAALHGGTARPVHPFDVLGRFLRALGVPGGAVPETLDERAEMYRGLLAGRTTLVVLDDAAGESQVVPLLPGSSDCSVIVTSRSRLTGLPGARNVEVETFDPDQSMRLLAHIAGEDRVRSEPASAQALAELCGQLPLALRIAGSRLSAHPHWSIEQLAGRLQDETRRLDELRHGGMGMRASIAVAYESTGEAARRLFRRLAILDFQPFPSWVSAALLDRPLHETQDLMDDLADAQLVEITGTGRGAHSRYRFHDLIRVFARERLAAEEPAAERGAALARVLSCLLHLARDAHREQYGDDYAGLHSGAARWPLPDTLVRRLVQQPLPWYERERLTLVSGIRQAAQAGLAELSWDLAICAAPFFESRVYLDDWRNTNNVAMAAARQAGDRRGQAAMHYSTGLLWAAEQRYADARGSLDTALELFRQTGDDHGVALTIRRIGLLERESGRFDEAGARRVVASRLDEEKTQAPGRRSARPARGRPASGPSPRNVETPARK
ncbi:AfsR/SARP family transcriptional regulator [Microbispora sp. H10885]|uniref:AfsR/SARP family transcriptional regulator n=1 Tax=Microbispora sp. H10885 TaxID=2729110 RepID=UPI0015FEB9E5|nr:BTAD domain-containing putative transcriptional regulator [Microbispora sp. H10885]